MHSIRIFNYKEDAIMVAKVINTILEESVYINTKNSHLSSLFLSSGQFFFLLHHFTKVLVAEASRHPLLAKLLPILIIIILFSNS